MEQKESSISKLLKKIGALYIRYNIAIGLGLTIIGLYLAISPPRRDPHLVINYTVFDLVKLNESNENLKIFFRGQDIEKEKLNLKVYSIKLENKGKSSIGITDFDPRIPFGIEVKNGFITGCNLVRTKDQDPYLLNNLYSNKIEDSTRILFNKVIIKPRQFVRLKFTVLHKENVIPAIFPLGRLSSSDIDITNTDDSKETDWWEVIKVFVYIALFIWGLIWLFKGIGWFNDYITQVIRKKIILKKYDHHFDSHNKIQRIIVKIYVDLGNKGFIETMNILKDSENLGRIYKEEEENNETIDHFNRLKKEKKIDTGNDKEDIEYGSDLLYTVELLEEVKLIQITSEGKIEMDQNLVPEINFALELL